MRICIYYYVYIYKRAIRFLSLSKTPCVKYCGNISNTSDSSNTYTVSRRSVAIYDWFYGRMKRFKIIIILFLIKREEKRTNVIIVIVVVVLKQEYSDDLVAE